VWPSGEKVELPARTVCVAAGTSPNVTYERETRALQVRRASSTSRRTRPPSTTTEAASSSRRPRRRASSPATPTASSCVSFYGDNHPSLRGQRRQGDGEREGRLPHVVALFRHDSNSPPRAARATPPPPSSRARRRAARRRRTTSSASRRRSSRSWCTRRGRAQVRARPVLPAAELRDARAVGRRHAPRDGGPRAHRRVGRPERGLVSTIALEMGGSSRASARSCSPGEP
jgi:hypothetical protein